MTRLSCYSFDYTRNVSPPPLSVFDFPLRGEPAGQRYDRHGGAKEGSSCKSITSTDAPWSGQKKSGDAYAIRAETLSDLIFVRGFSHGPERVLLIHFPRPSRRRYGLYSGGWQNDMPREACKCLCSDYENDFYPHSFPSVTEGTVEVKEINIHVLKSRYSGLA